MQKETSSKRSPLPTGGLVCLQPRATDLVSQLVPIWATACGVIASAGFSWRGQDWLRLALLILLVDGGWGTLWAALSGSDWATALRRWRQGEWLHGHNKTSVATLPYTLPGTAGGRLRNVLGGLQSWWREVLWPTCGSSVLAILAALAVTAALGALLGPELLLLSAGAMALMELGVVWEGGHSAASPGWDALISVALPWIAGHVTFGPVALDSAILAVLFALAWGNAWQTESGRGRILVISSQLVAIASLVVVHRPLAAGTLFLLLVPQLTLLPWTRSAPSATWYARYTRPWLMAAMAVTAFSLML